MPARIKINKMKQLMSFFFKGNSDLLSMRQSMLTSTYTELDSFLHFAMPLLQEGWIKTS